ncbi:MAG: hypothetical protein ACRDG3_05525 [Tepidiformaceae bacterium]
MAARPESARSLLETQVQRIGRLRGTGPNPFEYTLWEQRTLELVAEIYGAESPELERIQDAAGTRGRLPGVRGQAENMTLNIHGQWGILGRLQRSETVLREFVLALPAPTA